MPYADKVKQRAAQLAWMKRRRERWLRANGPCKRCGSWGKLQIHHRDPAAKVTHRVWTWAEDKMKAELAKCDVLCDPCHKFETAKHQRDLFLRPIRHGTVSAYKRKQCRCAECKAAYSVSRRAQYLRTGT